MTGLMRHIAACNNAMLPGGRLPLRLGAIRIGWVRPGLVDVLCRLGGTARPEGVAVADLPGIGRGLAERGLCRWRDEAFDVRADAGGPALTQIDRGALPLLGIRAEGVHLNGLVRRGDAMWLWVARRAADKLLDPGKLDHLVAGGVPAGLSPAEALVKEADEEASVPAALVADAVRVAMLDYAMDRPEGLRRDRLHCYDLELPDGFAPHPRDGEVAGFELWPIAAVLDEVRAGDGFKFNVNLVLIDLFIRLGMLPSDEATALRRALAGA